MATTLLVIIFAQPLTPVARAHTPESSSQQFHNVDLIVVNQYNRQSVEHDGVRRATVVYYLSFWNLYEVPPGTIARMAVWEYRGWSENRPLLKADRGWICDVDGKTIFAREVVYLVSDYDFEYRNRHFGWGRLVTSR